MIDLCRMSWAIKVCMWGGDGRMIVSTMTCDLFTGLPVLAKGDWCKYLCTPLGRRAFFLRVFSGVVVLSEIGFLWYYLWLHKRYVLCFRKLDITNTYQTFKHEIFKAMTVFQGLPQGHDSISENPEAFNFASEF